MSLSAGQRLGPYEITGFITWTEALPRATSGW